MHELPLIALVGTSRSGKTVISNILNRSPEVFCFGELHFFGATQYADLEAPLTHEESVQAYADFLDIQKNGVLDRGDNRAFLAQARQRIHDRGLSSWSALDVYRAFLADHTAQEKPGARPCEQTGGYVYHLDVMFRLLPGLRIIGMVRDPRFVLASKKKKWSWKRLREDRLEPPREWIRQKLQYHPWILTRMWTTTVENMLDFKGRPEMRIQEFEALEKELEPQVRELCDFAGIEYHREMCAGFRKENVEVGGVPSQAPANHEDTNRLCASIGLSPTELFLVQRFAAVHMQSFGYEHWPVRPNPLALLWYLFVLPLKLVLATLVNLKRIGKLADSAKRRFVLSRSSSSR